MKIIKKVSNKLKNILIKNKKNKYWKKIKKKYSNIIEYNYEIYTHNVLEFNQLKIDFNTTNTDYWDSQNNWQIGNIFKDREDNQYQFLIKKYIPYLDKKYVLCDIGCANGYWTQILSHYVKEIDAYEYSEKTVNFLLDKFINTNINVQQGDILTLNLTREYDSITFMAVLMYISTFDDCQKIAKKIYDSIKKGGKLLIKDTLFLGHSDLYMVDRMDGYVAIYRTPENYHSIFSAVGFNLINEEIIHEVNKEDINLHFQCRMSIWEK